MVLEYVEPWSKLSPLIHGGHEKFVIQSSVSFDQHCRQDYPQEFTKRHGQVYYVSFHLVLPIYIHRGIRDFIMRLGILIFRHKKNIDQMFPPSAQLIGSWG